MKKYLITNLVKYIVENNNIDLNYDELYKIAKWGLEGPYSFSGCWDDNEDDIESAIKCAMKDFENYLSIDYPIELGNIPDKPIIYRLIRLKDESYLNKNNLGFSWFSNPEQIKEPEFFDMLDYLKPFKNEEDNVYLIKGRTDINNIDMRNTLWQRTTQWWENEIVIIDDSNIEILSIDDLSKKIN